MTNGCIYIFIIGAKQNPIMITLMTGLWSAGSHVSHYIVVGSSIEEIKINGNNLKKIMNKLS